MSGRESDIDPNQPDDNRAEVMMEAGMGLVRAGDRKPALSFFEDAMVLFRQMRDERSASLAQAWLDAGISPARSTSHAHAVAFHGAGPRNE